MADYSACNSNSSPRDKILEPSAEALPDTGMPPLREIAVEEPARTQWFSPGGEGRRPVQSAPRRLSGPSPKRREGGILLVDDQNELRRLLCRALELEGYSVWQADGGIEALRVAEAEGNHIQLLLTDIRMPGMDGYELANELTRRRPDVRVLYMSGYSENLPPVGVPFLQKPFRLDTLKQEVERLLRRDWPAAV